jgi:UDP-N-acetylmuramate dehydrogenase
MALSLEFRKWLSRTFGNLVLFDEPMRRHTYFNIGGPADAVVKPAGMDQLIALIQGCRDFEIDWWVMGKGSNLLVKDRGIRGVMIFLDGCLNKIETTGETGPEIRLSAMAGVGLQTLCRHCLANGIGGLNFALGIPGSVGGAIMMNAGTSLGSMKDVIEAVSVLLPSGTVVDIPKEQLQFSYRSMTFMHPSVRKENPAVVILQGRFCLFSKNSNALKEEAERILHARSAGQPVYEKSAGCFFKNPESGPPAGRLIEEAGLKGVSVGDAAVSTLHANFIINRGNATATDVITLMQMIREAVNAKFNIILEPEVKIVGE